MTTRVRNASSFAIVLGVVFALLNVTQLVFLDGGWTEIVGVAIGIALASVGIARLRGWEGVRR